MLEQIYYGNSLENWGISLLIVVGGIILSQLILLANRMIILRITKRSKIRYDDLFFESLEKPVILGIILAAVWVASGRLNVSEQMSHLIAQTCRILVVLNVTWFIARFVVAVFEESFFRKKRSRRKEMLINQHLFPLIRRGLLIVIWVIGGVTALNVAGIGVMSLWGTLGIGGIALALASQDTVRNMLGGITILLDQPFRIGDTIKFDSTEGVVEDIGLRST
ncbi:MAG: mechanosensitive ion channel family protein, partial [Tannerella sp.]|nr:mechanosensitive ion channel family protein [Tannerella sp.]